MKHRAALMTMLKAWWDSFTGLITPRVAHMGSKKHLVRRRNTSYQALLMASVQQPVRQDETVSSSGAAARRARSSPKQPVARGRRPPPHHCPCSAGTSSAAGHQPQRYRRNISSRCSQLRSGLGSSRHQSGLLLNNLRGSTACRAQPQPAPEAPAAEPQPAAAQPKSAKRRSS